MTRLISFFLILIISWASTLQAFARFDFNCQNDSEELVRYERQIISAVGATSGAVFGPWGSVGGASLAMAAVYSAEAPSAAAIDYGMDAASDLAAQAGKSAAESDSFSNATKSTLGYITAAFTLKQGKSMLQSATSGVASGAVRGVGKDTVVAHQRDSIRHGGALDSHGLLFSANVDTQTRVPRNAGGAQARVPMNARAYMREVEAKSGLTIAQKQRTLLVNDLRETSYPRFERGSADYVGHKDIYSNNKSLKESIKRQWETETGQTWPQYPTIDPKTGLQKLDDFGNLKFSDYQLHHIVPQNMGGRHVWWNSHPVHPNHHQGGVHGRGSELNAIEKAMK